jgi:hypothetical protein
VTTTSELDQRLAAPGPAEGYARNLMRWHSGLLYPGLVDAVGPDALCRLGGYGDGLTTVSVRESALPEPFLRGVLGFRLAQFLQAGLMDPDLVYQRRLVCEPVTPAAGPETVHTITVTDAGQIVGYIGLVGSADPVPQPLDSPARAWFPAEVAHDVNLLAPFAAPGRTSHHAYEIKRFVRDCSMPRGTVRDRVPWHLMLAVQRAALRLAGVQVVLGDSSERGALRHLRLLGFEPTVIEGTRPRLPRSELMWPSYEFPPSRLAKPFACTVPGDLAWFMDLVESSLAAGDSQAQRAAVAQLIDRRRQSLSANVR